MWIYFVFFGSKFKDPNSKLFDLKKNRKVPNFFLKPKPKKTKSLFTRQ